MDLALKNQLFVVCGSSSGFGRAVAESLIKENARIIAVARRTDLLNELSNSFPGQVTIVTGDLREANTIYSIEDAIGDRTLHGILVNAGGPPAKLILKTEMEDWDKAYQLVMRWKIELIKRLVPRLIENQYGRILMLESQSVKQPIENLVLSNSFRAAIAGFAKTLSFEVAAQGVTINLLAPGSHATQGVERVIKKKSEIENITYSEAKKMKEQEIPVKRFGKPGELASLATWLLSEKSGFVTGQTISHDGGNIRFIFG